MHSGGVRLQRRAGSSAPASQCAGGWRVRTRAQPMAARAQLSPVRARTGGGGGALVATRRARSAVINLERHSLRQPPLSARARSLSALVLQCRCVAPMIIIYLGAVD